MLFQNYTACLPTGLACYKNEVKLKKDACTLPCKGIYADVVNLGVEDLHTRIDFRPLLKKYKEYKSGFNKDEGWQTIKKV